MEGLSKYTTRGFCLTFLAGLEPPWPSLLSQIESPAAASPSPVALPVAAAAATPEHTPAAAAAAAATPFVFDVSTLTKAERRAMRKALEDADMEQSEEEGPG